MRRVKHVILSLFLLTVFIAYQASITYFSHVHYVNGVMIVHSHPNNNQDHTHSEGQIITMAHVSAFVSTKPVVQYLGKVYLTVLSVFEPITIANRFIDSYRQVVSLRAPPVQW